MFVPVAEGHGEILGRACPGLDRVLSVSRVVLLFGIPDESNAAELRDRRRGSQWPASERSDALRAKKLNPFQKPDFSLVQHDA